MTFSFQKEGMERHPIQDYIKVHKSAYIIDFLTVGISLASELQTASFLEKLEELFRRNFNFSVGVIHLRKVEFQSIDLLHDKVKSMVRVPNKNTDPQAVLGWLLGWGAWLGWCCRMMCVCGNVKRFCRGACWVSPDLYRQKNML